MFADYFAKSELLFWPLVGFAIFFFTFLAVLAWVFLGSRRSDRFRNVAALPLQPDDDPPASRRRRT